MTEAAQKFVGEHDFRNFCKVCSCTVQYGYVKFALRMFSCDQHACSHDCFVWLHTVFSLAYLHLSAASCHEKVMVWQDQCLVPLFVRSIDRHAKQTFMHNPWIVSIYTTRSP